MSDQEDRDLLVYIRMLESGIVPSREGYHLDLEDIDEGLSSLSEDEQRKMRRKFRKLWRKAARKWEQECGAKNYIGQLSSKGATPPGWQRARRRALVRYYLQRSDGD